MTRNCADSIRAVRIRVTCLIACAAALAACGGGGGVPSQSVSTAATPASASSSSSTSSSAPAASSASAAASSSSSSPSPAISVSLSRARAALTVGQKLALTATTNDSAGVTWSARPAGGAFAPQTSASGAAVSFSASSAGVYTVSATSVTDKAKAATLTVAVTDLAGVYTYHDDLNRDGANVKEYALTPSTVSTAAFGKLFSCTTDGAIYAQPLWVANVTIDGAPHNVVYVATAHDGLWAFDADAIPCQKLWSVNLIDPSHGGMTGEEPVPSGPTGFLVGTGNGDISPEVGVIGTPVIDAATGTLYVVSKSVIPATGQNAFFQRLHAIDMTTGMERTGSPAVISATYPGTGDGTQTDIFSPRTQNQRPGLAFVPGAGGAPGTVYIAWSSHEDIGHYYGWIIGYTYDASGLTQSYALNITPSNTSANGYGGGIWMAGGAPAADASGNLYVSTGNGPFDANSASAPNSDYGDSLIKLAPAGGKLSVADYFTPSDQAMDDTEDVDFGACGATILADLPAPVEINGVEVTHLIIAAEERGALYLLNRDGLGGYTPPPDENLGALQQILSGNELTGTGNNGALYATGAFWNDLFYVMATGQTPQLQAYQLNTTTAQLSLVSTTAGFGYGSGTPSISAQGTTNGIVWLLDNSKYCTPESAGCGPTVLHAYDAANFASGKFKELWNSSQAAADAAGYPVKFTVPTVANGKVYVGTRGNNTGSAYDSTSINGELDVYGLRPD